MSGIHSAPTRSIRPFRSSEEYLFAMKEDLAEWLRDLYRLDITLDTFLDALETGAVLCQLANSITGAAETFRREFGSRAARVQLPGSGVTYVGAAQPGTFVARDNVSNFISWCRTQMRIKDVLMFETEDLVLRKNEKHFVLCLLELARRAARFGMAAPVLIQLEREIEEEIREELHLPPEETPLPKPQRRLSDFKNLDEIVQFLVSRCTCPTLFPMVKVSEGKYRVGDSSTLIFIRILRNHVMVRVGGGWDTLEHYLDKHDPCRCPALAHKQAKLASPQRPSAPSHEIMARLAPSSDGQGRPQPTLLLSRAQTPPPPVHWTSSAPPSSLRPGRNSSPPPRAASPGPRPATATGLRPPTPSRLRERSSKGQEDDAFSAAARTGRQVTRGSPSLRQTSSLPRPAPSPTPAAPAATQPNPPRPRTPVVLQRPRSQLSLTHPPPPSDRPLGHSWTPERLTSTVRQSPAPAGAAPQNRTGLQRQAGLMLPNRPSTPVRSRSPIKALISPQQQPPRDVPLRRPASTPPSPAQPRPGTPVIRTTGGHPAEGRGTSGSSAAPTGSSSVMNGGGRPGARQPREVRAWAGGDTVWLGVTQPSNSNWNNSNRGDGVPRPRVQSEAKPDRGQLFTPPPLSPEQERRLYRSLEHEILANLQQLALESDDSLSEEGGGGSCTPDTAPPVEEHPPESAPTAPRSPSPRPVASPPKPPQDQASFSAVVAELSRGPRSLRRVDVQRWVAQIPGGPVGSGPVEPEPDGLVVPRPLKASSWSSLGSSLEWREQTGEEGGAEHAASAKARAPDGPSERPAKSRTPSFKQRRALKQPERVPSIYKLKLRPKVRPRRDHRPHSRPSKIPTPVSYRQAQADRAAREERKPPGKTPPRRPHSSRGSSPMGSEEEAWPPLNNPAETVAGRDQESWV